VLPAHGAPAILQPLGDAAAGGAHERDAATVAKLAARDRPLARRCRPEMPREEGGGSLHGRQCTVGCARRVRRERALVTERRRGMVAREEAGDGITGHREPPRYYCWAIGSVRVNREPTPTVLSRVRSPPMARARSRLM